MKKNKVRTYLLYAIGEIALVVIGILIALQVNNWNENRKLAMLEVEYYKSLMYDLRSDSLEYNFKQRAAEHNITKLENIIKFIDLGYNFDEAIMKPVEWDEITYTDTLALVMSLSQAGFVQFPQIHENTIIDLRATGNIKLLESNFLKDQIIYYYNRELVYRQWAETYLPVRTDIDKSINNILDRSARVAYTTGQPLSQEHFNFETIVNNMKNRPELKGLAIGMYHTQWRIISAIRSRSEHLQELMNGISREIKNLES